MPSNAALVLKRTALLPALLLALLASLGEPAEAQTFVDVTDQLGIDFRHTAPPTSTHRLREIMGSGLAAFDYDGDGDIDLLFAGALPRGPALFRRTQHGRYREVTVAAGLAASAASNYGMGVAIADTDNDGDLDVYLTHVGADQLWQNNGDGTFSDITETSGLVADGWSTAATFCDVDRGGLLDLYVGSYVQPDPNRSCTTAGGVPDYCPPNVYEPASDRLFLNRGSNTFTDVGEVSGIAKARSPALGVMCHDFDSDHRADLFVANDGTPNHLWINQGDGTFVDEGIVRGVATNLFGQAEAGMGVTLGDADGDLRLDLFVTHVDGETNTLYLGQAGGVMLDGTSRSNLGMLSQRLTGFGTSFADLDLDGDLDLVVANGRVRRASRTPSPGQSYGDIYGEPDQLLINDGSGRFEDGCGTSSFCEHRRVSRGLAVVDLDQDGDLDLVASHSNERARIYENRGRPEADRWLSVRVLDGKRDAIGAEVVLDLGERRLLRPVHHTSGYLSSRDATAVFGLGKRSTVSETESLTIRWSDGGLETFDVSPSGRTIVERGRGLAP